MKKMTMMESSNIIGGFYNCTATTFEKTTVGGAEACTAVRNCTNKFGQPTKVMFYVPMGNCSATAAPAAK
ncbi:DUF4762 family protein [Serratia rhizosphaerae]|uniref:DUF4762 domain-containing protein n=1 Tax=Serratia rhizosphaerae TaxID=2597702 RepID=A0ABX6GJL4_9GAMM|nr:DUF4762 family protein [Serratia rhizosphaerae]MEB6337008.1 DUF4762 family protein [Serratia rhizosphaerae]QHA86427.1 DUF4762 domain-containing protein [Serratia rhizosphaerae]